LIVLNYNAFDFECCDGFDYDTPRQPRNFEVVFELSWTTFSTVVSTYMHYARQQSFIGCTGIQSACSNTRTTL
jgi:hypothetical protein